MYEKLTNEDVVNKCTKEDNFRYYEFSIKDKEDKETKFICSSDGLLFRKMKTGFWKEIQNTKNHAKGYNVIIVNKKQYSRAKLILFACNKINLDDKNKNIYHKNQDKLDCKIENLTLDVPRKSVSPNS